LLGIAGLGEDGADRLMQLIDELTVVEGEDDADGDTEAESSADDDGSAEPQAEGAESDADPDDVAESEA